MLTINELNFYTELGAVCLIFIHRVHANQMVSQIYGHAQLKQSRKLNFKSLMSLCRLTLQAVFSKIGSNFGISILLLFSSSLKVLKSQSPNPLVAILYCTPHFKHTTA